MRSTPMVALVLALVSGSSLAQRPLSIYVSADMEGVAGLSSTDDAAGRRLMTREVNAAIAVAFAEVAEGIPGVERAGPRTVRFRTQEYPDAYRMIRVLYKHLGP